MDNRGCHLCAIWGFFFRARIVPHALSPTARLAFSGFGLGKSDVSCRHMGWGGGGFLEVSNFDFLGDFGCHVFFGFQMCF